VGRACLVTRFKKKGEQYADLRKLVIYEEVPQSLVYSIYSTIVAFGVSQP
jgi:hypothetical protein